MAYQATISTFPGLGERLAALWVRICAAQENGSIRKELSALSRKSDSQLAANGLTREAEARRIIGMRLYY